jgi:hypothetical protein
MYPYRAWDRAYSYESRYYDVMTNTAPEVASYIGQLMDFAQLQYRQIFGFSGEIPRMKVNAYNSLKRYQVIARKAGLPNSIGMFMRQGAESTVHLAYISLPSGQTPTQVLLHEGTHQFISAAMDFLIPTVHARSFPEGMRTLTSVPLWLNEGMATYVESAYYDGSSLVTGEINQGRLAQLQFEIRRDSNISLRQLFSAKQALFNSSYYAAAWGVTYWFLHDSDSRKQALKRMILRRYFKACRTGFMEDPETEFRPFISKDFQRLWSSHLKTQQLRTFIALTIGKRGSFEKWEASWKRWILALDPEEAFGGLKNP